MNDPRLNHLLETAERWSGMRAIANDPVEEELRAWTDADLTVVIAYLEAQRKLARKIQQLTERAERNAQECRD